MGGSTYDDYIFYGDDKIIRTSPIQVKDDTKGLGYELFHSLKKHGNNIAQIVAISGETDTYDQLFKRCVRTALQLKKLGVEKGDVVCVCSYDDHINCGVPLIASFFIGAMPTYLEPGFSLMDTTHLLKVVPPKVIFVVQEGIRVVEEAVAAASISPLIVVFGDSDKHIKFSQLIVENPEESSFQPFIVTDIMSTAAVAFSSGTTGLPKGICLKQYRYFAHFVRDIIDGITHPTAVILKLNSLYWAYSTAMFYSVLISGCKMLLMNDNDVQSIPIYVLRYKVTTLFLNPIQAYCITQLPIPEGFQRNNVHIVTMAGGYLQHETVLKLKELFPNAHISPKYGQTEAAALTAFHPNSPKDNKLLLSKLDSCGRPVNGVTYKVVDVKTEETLGFNQEGELRVLTGAVMNGYYNMDSSSSFDSSGWLRTGDLVYYDEDFYFFIVGRIKDLLKYKGIHVPPASVEQVILTHPAVEEAVVFGIPHEIYGDLPTALVVLKSDSAAVDAEEIRKYVDGRLDGRKKLHGGLKIVNRLYYTPTKKFRRNYMRQLFLERKL